jgi:NAD(P)-dependent dehydrogenase (short-subunit alcohol dehydrogenase family)
MTRVETFSGRVSVITGGGSGIGRALAVELAARGSDIAICDVDDVGLHETEALVQERGRRVVVHRVDVADRGQMEGFAEAVAGEFGRIDAIVNNAGVSVSETIEGIRYEDFEWIVGINFWGVVYGTKAFLPWLRVRGDGWIVNVSSALGLVGMPAQSAYTATKFAVRGMTEALRQELAGSGITVSCVHPGAVKTNIARHGRLYRTASGSTDRDQMVEQFDQLAYTPPELAAKTIVRGMERRSPRILIGTDAYLLDALARLVPVSYPRILSWFSKSKPR